MSIIQKCPGLTSKSGFKWYIPFGKDSKEITLCEECRSTSSEECTISDFLQLCNCDGYLLKNQADNGLFNVSFWYNNNTKYYPVEPVDKDENIYKVDLPVGTKCNLFINCELADNQYFQYEILINGKPVKPDDANIFYKKSVIDKTQWFPVRADEKCLALISDVLGPQSILNNQTELTLRISVYQHEPMLVDQTTDTYYGDYTMLSYKTLGVNANARKSDYLNLIRNDYKYPVPLIGQGLMKQFTAKVFLFKFHITTSGQTEEADHVFSKLRDEALKVTENKLRKIQDESSILQTEAEHLAKNLLNLNGAS